MPISVNVVRSIMEEKFDKVLVDSIISRVDSYMAVEDNVKTKRLGEPSTGYYWDIKLTIEGQLSRREILFLENAYREVGWHPFITTAEGPGKVNFKMQLAPETITTRRNEW